MGGRADDADGCAPGEQESAEVFITDAQGQPEPVPSSDGGSRGRLSAGHRAAVGLGAVAVFVLGVLVGRGTGGQTAGVPPPPAPGASITLGASTPSGASITSSASAGRGGLSVTGGTTVAAQPQHPAGSSTIPTGPLSTRISSSTVALSWLDPSSSGWELFAYSRDESAVLRIQPAADTVTRTAVPEVQDHVQVSFVARRHAAFVHPRSGPGYVISDGKPAERSEPTIGDGGVLWPGPEPNLLWTGGEGSGGSEPTYQSVTVQGDPSGPPIHQFEAPTLGMVRPDGGGYLLVGGQGPTYQLGNGDPHVVTPGAVVAAGQAGWVAQECDDHQRCTLVAIDRDSGQRHTASAVLSTTVIAAGSASPDGAHAAFVTATDSPLATVIVMDLATGALHRIHLSPGPVSPGTGNRPMPQAGPLAWSPDGQWLLVATQDGVTAIDPESGGIRDLDVPLGSVMQLSVRPAS